MFVSVLRSGGTPCRVTRSHAGQKGRDLAGARSAIVADVPRPVALR